MLKHFVQSLLNAPDSVVGLNQRNFGLISKLNHRRDYQLANDKILAKDFLGRIGVPTAETYHVYTALFELDSVIEDLKNYSNFVIKPANGSRGNGILILEQPEPGKYFSLSGKNYTQAELKYFIASIIFGKFSMGQQDQALIERMLVPDSRIKSLSYGGFSDIRVLISQEKFILAMLRLATKASDGKANLHQGGIGVGVDLQTGVTTHAILKDRQIQIHPDTKAELIGFMLPEWNRILELSRLIAEQCPLKYIGVDLIIDDREGPMVIEFNARPGLEIQNANQIGIMDLL